PESSIERLEDKLAIPRAVEALPERRRLVVRQHLEGRDISQIATVLNWRENQVRHLLYRGLAEVREKLKPRIFKQKTQTSRNHGKGI
ncbi:MAG: sigma factor-like helix-turn-helix DNA-binding protein, partial [Acidobacteriota bacterium]